MINSPLYGAPHYFNSIVFFFKLLIIILITNWLENCIVVQTNSCFERDDSTMPLTNKLTTKASVKFSQTGLSQSNSMTVLLLEEYPSFHLVLKNALNDFNYHITKSISVTDSITEYIGLYQPDVFVLSIKVLSKALIKELDALNKTFPLPIVIFAENDCPSLIKCSIKAGVSAYVAHEVSPKRIHSIICVAKERFKEVQSLRHELTVAKMELKDRKLIERAKGHLMQLKNISEKEAYGMLRKMAMDQSSPISLIAKNIIDVYKLLVTPTV